MMGPSFCLNNDIGKEPHLLRFASTTPFLFYNCTTRLQVILVIRVTFVLYFINYSYASELSNNENWQYRN